MKKLWTTAVYALIILVAAAHVSFGAQLTKVALFISRSENDMFFGPVVDFMQEAVNDLEGMTLKVYYADADQFTMQKQAEQAVADVDKPDALVILNYRKRGKHLVKIAEEARIPIFVFNDGFLPEDNMGKPREKYKYWIGEMLPDDEGSGFELAKALISQATPAADGKIHLIGIEGKKVSMPSIRRLEGLQRFLQQTDNTVLHQIVAADWDPALAKEKFLHLQKRFPQVSVVWTASDGMGLGVTEGAKTIGITPGKDILTGGVDWAKEGLEAVKSGEMTASIGGHFMEGAWVAVLLYDYFNGIDFASESLQMRSQMSAISSANIDEFLDKLSKENWHNIDFTKFSKKYHPELKHYNFGLEAVLGQL